VNIDSHPSKQLVMIVPGFDAMQIVHRTNNLKA